MIEQFLPRESVLTRTVTELDAADPTTLSGHADSRDRGGVRFDLDASGSTGLTALTVQALFWNAAAGKWMHGERRAFDATALAEYPRPALHVETFGAPCYLKVVAATATALSVAIYATPW